ncbi:MAG: hypothetical protein QOI61_2326 [Actinomycetota bacterium]
MFIDQNFAEIQRLISVDGLPASDLEDVALRNFSPSTGELSFQGARFDVNAAIEAASQLIEIADAIDAELTPWPQRHLQMNQILSVQEVAEALGRELSAIEVLLEAGLLALVRDDEKVGVPLVLVSRYRARELIKEVEAPIPLNERRFVDLAGAAELLRVSEARIREFVADQTLTVVPGREADPLFMTAQVLNFQRNLGAD